MVAVSVVSTVSAWRPVAPKGPTTSGARSHSPAVTGVPVALAAHRQPLTGHHIGVAGGLPRSNWMGSLPLVVAVPSIAVVSLGTR